MPIPLRPSPLVLCLLAAFGPAGSSFAAQATGAAPRVPPGFEALVEGQIERVEVVLFGKKLGLFPAKVSLDTLQFDDPGIVADSIPLRDTEDRDRIRVEIAQALTEPLARNGNLACQGKSASAGCGYVETDRAAIVYDESRGVVELFLARRWIDTVARADQRYESVSGEARNAFVHRQFVNLSAGKDYRSLSLQGAGALGVGDSGHIGGDWSFMRTEAGSYDNTQVRFNNLYFRQDWNNRHYAQVGRMDQRNLSNSLGGSFGFSMLPLPRFDGVRIGSTQAYRNTSHAGDATPVTVLLTRDARVDIFRGGELLGTEYMSAGVQKLDTARLPTGSYPLTLRVYENGVLARSENVPFSRTGSGFGDTETQWFVQGGRVVADDDRLSGRDTWGKSAVAQAGVRIGITPDLFLTSGLASLDGGLYNETKAEWQKALSLGVLSTSASFLASNDGSRGNSQQLSFSNGMSWSLYRYQMRGAACDRAIVNPGDIGCYDSLSGSVSFPLGDWSMLAGYTYSKSRGRPLYDAQHFDPYGPIRALLPLDRASIQDAMTRAIQLSATRSFKWGKAIFNTRLGVYWNSSKSGSVRNDAGVFAGVTVTSASQPPNPDGGSSHASGSIDVRSSRHTDAQIGYSANYSRNWQNGTYRELGLAMTGYRDESYTGTLSGRMEGRYGNLNGTVSNTYQRREGRNYPALTGSYSSSFAVSDAGMYWGSDVGNTEPSAGLAVRVRENGENSGDAAAEVRGDAVRSFKLGYGESALLPIGAYQRSTAEVRDATSHRASASVNVASGGGANEYFLPPGKLVLREVASETTFTYVGRALDGDGLPLAGAAVLNALVPSLDEQGGFVLDVQAKLETLYLLHHGQAFACPVQVVGRRDVVQLVGTLRCLPVVVSKLPSGIRNLPRVGRLLAMPRQTAGLKSRSALP